VSYVLCKTCARAPDCVYRKGRENVFQCEEFEGERTAGLQPSEKRGSSAESGAAFRQPLRTTA